MSLYGVLPYTLLCWYVRVTTFTSFPCPLSSMSRGFAFIGSFTRILGRLVALQVNAFWSSIIAINNIMYLIGCSFVLGTVDLVYCTIFGMQNYIASFIIENFFLLHILLCYVVLLLDLVTFVDFGSPCDLCLSLFYRSYLEKKLLRIWILTTSICLDLISNKFSTNCRSIKPEKNKKKPTL